MLTHRRTLTAAAALAALLSAGPYPAAAATVSLTTDPANPEIVVGRVRLGAPPAVVWNRLRRVDEWPRLFTDVRKLEVRRHQGDHWVVRLDSAVFKCGPHDYEVHFKSDQAAELRIDAPGIDASGTLSIVPAPGGSIFEHRLRVHVGRVVGWFVSERDVRDRQWRLVRAYLIDLERAFGASSA